MALITKSRLWTCPPGPIDPYGPFQPEITATLVSLEAKNVTLNPPQEWGFQALKTLSSDCFGPIEHLAGYRSPNLDFGHVHQDPLIHTKLSNKKVQPLE